MQAQIEHLRWDANLLHQTAIAIVLGCLSAVSGFATRPARGRSYIETPTAPIQAASGRIRSIQGNTFTLEATAPGPRSTEAPSHKILNLIIDQETKVQGKIAVGAIADVTYRLENGNNIAVSVHVRSQFNSQPPRAHSIRSESLGQT